MPWFGYMLWKTEWSGSRFTPRMINVLVLIYRVWTLQPFRSILQHLEGAQSNSMYKLALNEENLKIIVYKDRKNTKRTNLKTLGKIPHDAQNKPWAPKLVFTKVWKPHSTTIAFNQNHLSSRPSLRFPTTPNVLCDIILLSVTFLWCK